MSTAIPASSNVQTTVAVWRDAPRITNGTTVSETGMAARMSANSSPADSATVAYVVVSVTMPSESAVVEVPSKAGMARSTHSTRTASRTARSCTQRLPSKNRDGAGGSPGGGGNSPAAASATDSGEPSLATISSGATPADSRSAMCSRRPARMSSRWAPDRCRSRQPTSAR